MRISRQNYWPSFKINTYVLRENVDSLTKEGFDTKSQVNYSLKCTKKFE